MQTYRRQHRVPFTAQQMYDLVLEIESYPEYLPFCEGLSVISRVPTGEGETIIADMKIGYKQFTETYRSEIITTPSQHRIDVACAEGPLKTLENIWIFTDIEGQAACNIDLCLGYVFRNPLMQLAMNSVLDKASNKFLKAFEERAFSTYTQA